MCFFICSSTFASEETPAGNVRYPDEVTYEMTNPDYWINLLEIPYWVLLNQEAIQKINAEIVSNGDVNHVVDVEEVTAIPFGGIEAFNRELYLDGVLIDEAAVVEELKEGIEDIPELLYAVTIKRANIRAWPTSGFLGYNENDPDDELQNSVLEINSPVVISKKCIFRDDVFYFCQSEVLTGWINSEELAICKNKEEWVGAWKVDPLSKDFLVVTQDKIVLEPMLYEPEISEVELMLGSTLKLVPEDEIPDVVGERQGTNFNYVVYIPTRDADDMYVRKVALIPARYNVSVGYLPFTEANLTKVAFELLGNRYGWGGTMKSYDSSLFNRQVYKCFGFTIPTNTTWQKSIPGYATDLSEMSPEEKLLFVKKLPIGSILYIKGCSMQYIGYIGDTIYVISDIGVYSDSLGEVESRRYYTVSILPMTARRGNGEVFFDSLNYALCFLK